MTSSRRSCSKSTSISGGSRRSSRDEALEQQALAHGIDRGDAEHEADGRVGGRAAPLAENAFGAREADDGFDGQEVGRIFQALDQVQFMPQLHRDVVGQCHRDSAARHLPRSASPAAPARSARLPALRSDSCRSARRARTGSASAISCVRRTASG